MSVDCERLVRRPAVGGLQPLHALRRMFTIGFLSLPNGSRGTLGFAAAPGLASGGASPGLSRPCCSLGRR